MFLVVIALPFLVFLRIAISFNGERQNRDLNTQKNDVMKLLLNVDRMCSKSGSQRQSEKEVRGFWHRRLATRSMVLRDSSFSLFPKRVEVRF